MLAVQQMDFVDIPVARVVIYVNETVANTMVIQLQTLVLSLDLCSVNCDLYVCLSVGICRTRAYAWATDVKRIIKELNITKIKRIKFIRHVSCQCGSCGIQKIYTLLSLTDSFTCTECFSFLFFFFKKTCFLTFLCFVRMSMSCDIRCGCFLWVNQKTYLQVMV